MTVLEKKDEVFTFSIFAPSSLKKKNSSPFNR